MKRRLLLIGLIALIPTLLLTTYNVLFPPTIARTQSDSTVQYLPIAFRPPLIHLGETNAIRLKGGTISSIEVTNLTSDSILDIKMTVLYTDLYYGITTSLSAQPGQILLFPGITAPFYSHIDGIGSYTISYTVNEISIVTDTVYIPLKTTPKDVLSCDLYGASASVEVENTGMTTINRINVVLWSSGSVRTIFQEVTLSPGEKVTLVKYLTGVSLGCGCPFLCPPVPHPAWGLQAAALGWTVP